MVFGEKLREILEERNISQKEFAYILNIAPTTLSGYINSKRQPDFDLVKKMASELNVSIDYLFDFHNNSLQLTARELCLIEKIQKMNKQQQDIIYDLVNLTYSKTDTSHNN